MQYESKKCQDQTGMKNDKLDDKTRWELIPLDCLEDIARVYTEGAKKYGDNNWQNLESGYERYKGALLRHLYAAESETFDEILIPHTHFHSLSLILSFHVFINFFFQKVVQNCLH